MGQRLQNLRHAIGFGYDAVKPSPIRKTRKVVLMGEDAVLKGKERRQALSNTRELKRNFAVAAWAIRTHCADVAQHSFQSRMNDPEIDGVIEALVADWSRPINFDAAGRHSLAQSIRLAEMASITDGAVYFNDLGDGRYQMIEDDRIAKPKEGGPKLEDDQHVDGVIIDEMGRATGYIVCKRTKSDGREFLAELDADQVLAHAYYDRPDQVRGVSPMLAALNAFQDIAESAEYALAKAKVSTFFGVKVQRGADWEPPENAATQKIKLGDGPQFFEVAHDEDAEFMHSDQPGPAFREYLNSMLMMALKALDLDFCFYDSSHTNYSGARQAWLVYERTAAFRQAQVRDLLNEMTRRRLQLAVDSKEITLPSGIDFEQLRWDWIPRGRSWIDPLKEVRAQAAAIAGGFKSRTMVCREVGSDFREVADQLAEEADYLNQKGLDTANAAQLAAIGAAAGDDDETDEESKDTKP